MPLNMFGVKLHFKLVRRTVGAVTIPRPAMAHPGFIITLWAYFTFRCSEIEEPLPPFPPDEGEQLPRLSELLVVSVDNGLQ